MYSRNTVKSTRQRVIVPGLHLKCKAPGGHIFSHPVHVTLKSICCHGVKSTLSHQTRLYFCNSVQCLFSATAVDHFSHCISRQRSAEPALQRRNKSGEKLIFLFQAAAKDYGLFDLAHIVFVVRLLDSKVEVQIQTIARFVPKLLFFFFF